MRRHVVFHILLAGMDDFEIAGRVVGIEKVNLRSGYTFGILQQVFFTFCFSNIQKEFFICLGINQQIIFDAVSQSVPEKFIGPSGCIVCGIEDILIVVAPCCRPGSIGDDIIIQFAGT